MGAAVLTAPRLGRRLKLAGCCGLAALAALALAGCSTGEPASHASRIDVGAFGDRTVALTYASQDPTVAYFAPGGRLFVWDGGEQRIVEGRWFPGERSEVCATLNVSRKDASPPAPLRAQTPVCAPAARAAYRGDVFSLNGLTDAPYILSHADNERLLTVLHDAERVRG